MAIGTRRGGVRAAGPGYNLAGNNTRTVPWSGSDWQSFGQFDAIIHGVCIADSDGTPAYEAGGTVWSATNSTLNATGYGLRTGSYSYAWATGVVSPEVPRAGAAPTSVLNPSPNSYGDSSGCTIHWNVPLQGVVATGGIAASGSDFIQSINGGPHTLISSPVVAVEGSALICVAMFPMVYAATNPAAAEANFGLSRAADLWNVAGSPVDADATVAVGVFEDLPAGTQITAAYNYASAPANRGLLFQWYLCEPEPTFDFPRLVSGTAAYGQQASPATGVPYDMPIVSSWGAAGNPVQEGDVLVGWATQQTRWCDPADASFWDWVADAPGGSDYWIGVKRLSGPSEYDAIAASPPKVVNASSAAGTTIMATGVMRGFVKTGTYVYASAADSSTTPDTGGPPITTTGDGHYVLTVIRMDDDDFPTVNGVTDPRLYPLVAIGSFAGYASCCLKPHPTAKTENLGWSWASFESTGQVGLAMIPSGNVALFDGDLEVVGDADVTGVFTAEVGGIPITGAIVADAVVTCVLNATPRNFAPPRRVMLWVRDINGNRRVAIR